MTMCAWRSQSWPCVTGHWLLSRLNESEKTITQIDELKEMLKPMMPQHIQYVRLCYSSEKSCGGGQSSWRVGMNTRRGVFLRCDIQYACVIAIHSQWATRISCVAHFHCRSINYRLNLLKKKKKKASFSFKIQRRHIFDAKNLGSSIFFSKVTLFCWLTENSFFKFFFNIPFLLSLFAYFM